MTHKSQKQITRKIFLKKNTYPNNKKNLWTNHKYGLSKNNYNKSITNPSQNKSQKPNNFYLISPSHLRALCLSQMTPSHRHKDNSYIVDRFIHTLVNHQKLGSVGVFNSSVKKNYLFFEQQIYYYYYYYYYYYFKFLLTLGHTWHACVRLVNFGTHLACICELTKLM